MIFAAIRACSGSFIGFRSGQIGRKVRKDVAGTVEAENNPENNGYECRKSGEMETYLLDRCRIDDAG